MLESLESEPKRSFCCSIKASRQENQKVSQDLRRFKAGESEGQSRS